MPKNNVFRGHVLLLISNEDVILIFCLVKPGFGTDRTSFVQRKCALTVLVDELLKHIWNMFAAQQVTSTGKQS